MKNRTFITLIIVLAASVLMVYGSKSTDSPIQQPTAPNTPAVTTQNNPTANNATASFLVTTPPSNNSLGMQQAAIAPVVGNSSYKTRIGTQVNTPDGTMTILQKYQTAATPNDPLAAQWWHTNIGITSSWNLPAPSEPVLLAVIDTGFAMAHEEFANRFYSNVGEIGATASQAASKKNCTDRGLALDTSCNNVDDNADGIVDNESGSTTYENPSLLNCTDQSLSLNKSCNRIDDDGNGYIDDTTGWDFVNQDPSPQAGQLNPSGSDIKHGSMVMGIAAATTNNAKGVAGVDSYTKLLPLQAIDDDGYGDSLTVGNAIRYAADMGADVINLSLGTNGSDSYILSSVEYAHAKGSIVVAAAGNDGCNCMIYPARYEIAFSVGATDQTGNRASYSSYGSTLDIMAPGSSITSTSFSPSAPTNTYATGSGTSYAAPVISGLLSKIKGQLPTASPAQLAALLTEKTTQNNTGTYYKATEKGYGDASISNSITRATTPKVFKQLTTFGSVANGGIFQYSNSPIKIYACEAGAAGTTPVYKSTKTSTFFSINAIDTRIGTVNGYALQQLFSACVAQPHDTFEKIRSLNTAQEFTNISAKSLLSL